MKDTNYWGSVFVVVHVQTTEITQRLLRVLRALFKG